MTKPVTGPSNLGDRGRRRPCRVPIERGGGRERMDRFSADREGPRGDGLRGRRRRRRRRRRPRSRSVPPRRLATGTVLAVSFQMRNRSSVRPSVRAPLGSFSFLALHTTPEALGGAASLPPSLPPRAPLTLISIRAHSLARLALLFLEAAREMRAINHGTFRYIRRDGVREALRCSPHARARDLGAKKWGLERDCRGPSRGSLPIWG